jgi:hypothetical protein
MHIGQLNRQRLRTVLELTSAVADWLENSCNTERRHNSLNYLIPNEYEDLHSNPNNPGHVVKKAWSRKREQAHLERATRIELAFSACGHGWWPTDQ